MRADPSVTIYIRAYNAERFLIEAVNSVIKQDFQGDLFIKILCDTESTDKTLEVVENLNITPKPNVFIEILKRPHLSPFRQLFPGNTDSPNSDFITFLDYDNYWPPNYLKQAIEAMRSKKIQFLFSNPTMIDESGEKLGRLIEMPSSVNKIKRIQIYTNLIDTNAILMSEDGYKVIESKISILNIPVFDWVYEDWVVGSIGLLELSSFFDKDLEIYYRVHQNNSSINLKGNPTKSYLNRYRGILSLIAILKVEKKKLNLVKRAIMLLRIIIVL